MRIEEVEELAKILHESGRHVPDRDDLPFVEWEQLHDDAQEGRRVMARYLLAHPKIYFASK